ncbi:methyltransferase [Fusarium mundagurra]|uniref:Methyltransferase n=1 Tax=Fusarium mundagurra TaxID=1567541 RepID=A0A8H5YXH8_9HYPO|nr:methyltransferase [Fusarium mundagurra]
MQRDGTVPLDETFTETIEHYGRSYQHYSLTNGTYFAPIDEDEISRLEVMHGVLSRLFDGRLIFPPIRSPRRILDCGCGPGDWAIEVATQYPDAEVLGIDVSPHMIPENPPDNMELQVDDLNGRFTFRSNHFDVVHSQMVAGGIHANRWRSYIRDIFRVLNPGGWCQMVEIYFNAQSDNATIQRSAGTTSIGQLDEKCRVHGSRVETLDVANVRLVEWWVALMPDPLYPFTQFLGMSFSDFQLLIAQARSEASNPAFKAYFPVYVSLGHPMVFVILTDGIAVMFALVESHDGNSHQISI